MKRNNAFKKLFFLLSFHALFLLPFTAHASLLQNLAYVHEGSYLSGAPSYSWWYGCSPTSAGMMVGYYDTHGYSGLTYNNLVRGGDAETSTYPSTAGSWTYRAQTAIASSGHVSAYYQNGYGGSGDDDTTLHDAASYDSLADFMGTSQDAYGNSNGATTFYYKTDGSRLTAQALQSLGSSYYDRDGMFGIWEYFNYSGYQASMDSFFTQKISSDDAINGFTFEDYVSEIDAGRVVMIHVDGHSMFGFGYGDNESVYLYDTWTEAEHSMTWGGSYAGLSMWGVTGFTPSGGSPVPLPSAVFFLCTGLCGLFRYSRKFQA